MAEQVRDWRRRYIQGLVALVVVQATLRLIFRYPVSGETAASIALHFSILLAWPVAALFAASLVPQRWRELPLAGVVAVAMLALGHTLMTLFDLAQLAMRHYADMPAPVWVIFSPRTALNLVGTMGFGPSAIIGTLGGLYALHVLLYAPALSWLGDLSHRVMVRPVPLPYGRRVTLFWLASAYLLFFMLLLLRVPTGEWAREPFHVGSVRNFQMAPVALQASATDPLPPPLPAMPASRARPVILIVVDALRRDRMGVYDPALETTPFLSSLANAGQLVTYPGESNCTFTICGVIGLLSSRSWDDFGRRPPTVFDALSRHGYRSYAFLAGNHSGMMNLTQLYGRGIEIVSEDPISKAIDDSAMVARLGEATFPDPRHTMVYVHMISAHAGTLLQPRFAAAGPATPPHLPPGADLATVRAYDGRVRQSDDFIRRIFDVLRAKGLLDDAIVIVTADHGEQLGEGGLYYHGGRPLPHGTGVPLLIYDAAGDTYPSHPVISQIDIAPTLLRAIGGTLLPEWRGHPLQEAAHRAIAPLGTYETVGVIAMLANLRYRYFCERQTGKESVFRARPGDLRETWVAAPAPSLLKSLRARIGVRGVARGKCPV